ncbi:hypothetical protein OKA04_03170 [Luteolibacter flavescens]|uniref:Uncharacterized protein n=1 Tax=Luteolibacter flavescens TaxID=1859460 RepID=A0ABT3FJG6_9BACT|nr:hypothetical protein [Luteolibacter flavescens]MCW1883713.1 hypothetical protein [Luteolibacter flavescens]
MNDLVHGEPSWKLSLGGVSLWISCRAGHMAPVEFQLGERTVSPYALAPWTPDEVDSALPPLLTVLRGDFLCFPFGGQKSAPPHGVAANAEWKIVAGGDDRLHLGMDDQDSGGWLEKIVILREGETAIYCEHRISGVEGDYSYGNHPVMDFSRLTEGEGLVSVSPFRWGSVYQGLFSNPLNREYGALKPSATFTDLREVPLATGGTADVSKYPARQGFDDSVMMHAEPATEEQPFAWSAAVFDGYVWFSLKNPADFPSTLLWISNGGRHGAPWNGRHFGRMGIEEVCSYFADSVDVSRTNPLAAEGVPTTRAFRKDETVSLRLIQAVAAVPERFGRVISITPAGPGKVVISGESGTSVEAPIDWNFIL